MPAARPPGPAAPQDSAPASGCGGVGGSGGCAATGLGWLGAIATGEGLANQKSEAHVKATKYKQRPGISMFLLELPNQQRTA